jgi:hypothetical protein
MNLMDMVLNAQNGDAVRQLGKNFNLPENDTQEAIRQLMPALSRGVKRNIGSEDGLSALLAALGTGKHQRYIDRPEELGREEAQIDGNNILGHILGSKEVSRKVAGAASGKTGINTDILKKMLPMIATMAMGALSKQSASQGMAKALGGGQSSGAMDMLSSFLDADKDGSALDDLLGMAGKFF